MRAGDKDEFYTPTYIFDPLYAEFGFTVDACAKSLACAKLTRFWDPDQDGLEQDWDGERVWLNPPYSNIATWVDKAHREMRYGKCGLVVCLLPATRSEQWWWHTYIEPYRDERSVDAAVKVRTRFIRQRIRFNGPAAKHSTGRFPSLLVIWSSA